MNVLIDTSVLVSAAVRDRLPERVVLHVASQVDLRWIVTPAILAEYVAVLRRPKFRLDSAALQHWELLLNLRTLNIGQPPDVPEYPRDPKDTPFLAAALAAPADLLITGDKDLLAVRLLLTTRVLTVVESAAEFQLT